jgi:List-Bact-rpt repeat protein
MRSAPAVAAAIAVIILLGSAPQSQAIASTATSHPAVALSPRPGSMGLSGAPVGLALATPPPPTYDEQLGASFTQDFAALAYNVTAVAQTDSEGYGPAYLLNGLTPAGFWYQVGISYHWPDSNGGYDPTFGFSYEVYGPDGKTTYPSGGGAGLGNFSGVVHSGDSVLLSLTFTGSDVQMLAKDWSTGATASASYSNEGSSIFVGDAVSPDNVRGFFTGLMTEWYHVGPYYGNEEQVTYSNNDVALTSAWMWIDEFQGQSTAPTLFDNQTQSPVALSSDGQISPFSADGASMYITAYEFVTGTSGTSSTLRLTPDTPATSGEPSPRFVASYTFAGQPQTANISPGTTVLDADPGTVITVAIPADQLGGQWVFSLGTSSDAVNFTAGTNATFVYYNWVPETISYQVAGGGQALPSAPVLTYQEPPQVASATPGGVNTTLVLTTTPTIISAILGSVASLNGPIEGASGERWATSQQFWTFDLPDVIPGPLEYYQQYDVSVGYSIAGGGTPPEIPEFNSTAFGEPAGIKLLNNSTTGWFDGGSGYSFTSVLNGSTSTERWLYGGGTGLVCIGAGPCVGSSISSPDQEIIGGYSHQYFVDLGISDTNAGVISGSYSRTTLGGGVAGSVSPGPSWMDTGQNLSLRATANSGWRFETWAGSGAGAYSGTSAAIDVMVTGPLTENATFYAGLAIFADLGANVAYSYGSQSGTVSAGTTKTLYVQPSSNVTLLASPSLFVYSFASWKGAGLSRETNPSLTVLVDSPTAVTGTSSPNYPVVLGAAAIAAIILILSISLWTRNRRSRSYDAFYPG